MFLNPFVQGVMQAVQLFLEQQFMFLIYIDLLLTEYRLRTPLLRRDFRRDAQWADYASARRIERYAPTPSHAALIVAATSLEDRGSLL